MSEALGHAGFSGAKFRSPPPFPVWLAHALTSEN
jgi:hypothetical protein